MTVLDIELEHEGKRIIVRFIEHIDASFFNVFYSKDGIRCDEEIIDSKLRNNALMFVEKIIKEENYVPLNLKIPFITTSEIKQWYLSFRLNALFN
jgi:hypothetical protein